MSNGDQGASAATAGPKHLSDEPQKKRKWLPWLVGGVLVAFVVGIVLAVTLTSRSDVSAESGSPASPSGSSSTSPPSSPSPSTDAAAPAPSETAGGTEQFPELPAVDPQQPGTADGISVMLSKFESVTGEVVGPGDVAAAAVRVTVDITNTGPQPLDLNLVVMNAYMGVDRDPAETYEQPGGQPVSGSLAAGDTVQGVYLFRIPENRRDDVTFVVDYHAGQAAITWRGQIP